ncbi:PREDICTED: probable G-protein coupled receptor B0563.6 [Nicrophorus vespilloides]|uniref:Probable G-protein coupled receptor B0563.6 n=1 Tax=Nicrophorus vespilloides TaxID=110193 RepID=A0ABM1NIP5_NICVS|nr:PREDICTED: probable G-protein coupled receptor B0563.6 [Nicrophorus vespilloides]
MITRILSGATSYCDGIASNRTIEMFANATVFEPTADIRSVAYRIIAPVTICVGILGNIMNLLVLTTRPFLKGGTRVYLTALSISDLSVMVTVIPMVMRWNHSQWKTAEAAFYHAHVELFLNNTFIASSVFIVVCLTIERYFSVCLPTMFRSVHTVRIAKLATLGCFLTALAVSAPLTTMKTVCMVKGNLSCTDWDFHENNAITDTIYWGAYLWCSECLVRFGPCLILATLNILIIRKFRKITAKRKVFREATAFPSDRFDAANHDAKLRRALRNKKYQEEKRLVTLLRAIVVLFFVTMTPSAVLSLLYSELHEPAFGFQVFRAFANNLELANFGLNFYVYFFCSKEFRAALLHLARGCLACEEEPTEESVDNERIKNMLKVIKLSETSDFNSTGERWHKYEEREEAL